ncbi:MAG: phosphopantothenoylcysteine decarboxylase, partial [Lentimicrobium sp.]|nr:phosphopantothenoylcysteine decarboxylase [Lentimicrobium sp.]
YALAEAIASRGAEVILVSGPVHLKAVNPLIKIISVQTAIEMAKACIAEFPGCSITIMAAAVADFTIESPASHKIKKEDKKLSIDLKPTTDILASLGKMKQKGQFLVGFALETDNETENARKKLQNKNLDLIVLNSLNDKGAGFGTDTNKVRMISANGDVKDTLLLSKVKIAEEIVSTIISLADIIK